ncbi:MAG: sterol desaturase family protein [Methylocystis sp.]|nr:sterol desaturase family protein [Methylocystis sp.]
MSAFAFFADRLYAVLISPGSNFSIFSLAAALLVACGFLARRQRTRRGQARPRAIWRALRAKDIALHRSTRADFFYFGLNVFITGFYIGWACLSGAQVSRFTEGALTQAFGARAPLEAPVWTLRTAATVALFLAYEFGYWFDHYLKHRIPALWETHKTHHTAERLTPLTVGRVHPLDSLILANMLALCVGAAGGALSYAFGARFRDYTLDGANILLVVFFITFVNLQHSEVWLPLRGTLGKLFMSPAHHQIHHSIDPAYYNSNLGNALAVFDWLFGTLTMPAKENPRLAYGVVEPGVDPHSITQLIAAPFANVVKALVPHNKPAAPGCENPAKVSR